MRVHSLLKEGSFTLHPHKVEGANQLLWESFINVPIPPTRPEIGWPLRSTVFEMAFFFFLNHINVLRED